MLDIESQTARHQTILKLLNLIFSFFFKPLVLTGFFFIAFLQDISDICLCQVSPDTHPLSLSISLSLSLSVISVSRLSRHTPTLSLSHPPLSLSVMSISSLSRYHPPDSLSLSLSLFLSFSLCQWYLCHISPYTPPLFSRWKPTVLKESSVHISTRF